MDTVQNIKQKKSKRFNDFSLQSTRMMLFYADDITEKAQEIRSQIGNYMPNQDGRSCSFEVDRSKFQSENFVKDLRKNHGIFFDCGFLPD